jgi:transcriptional regulator NrdR family protein
MKCKGCGCAESKVKKTLIHVEQMGGPAGFQFGDLKMRVRECLECGRLFETFEVQRDAFERIAKAKPVSESWSQRKPIPTPGPRRPLKGPKSLNLDLRRDHVDD